MVEGVGNIVYIFNRRTIAFKKLNKLSRAFFFFTVRISDQLSDDKMCQLSDLFILVVCKKEYALQLF